MRTILFTALCVLPLVSYAAPPQIETSTLQFSNLYHDSNWLGGEPPPVVDLQVLSSTVGSTTITTSAWDWVSDFEVAGSFSMGGNYRVGMDIAPQQGYVITGFTFSATLAGKVSMSTVSGPGVYVSAPAYAHNEFTMSLPDGAGGSISKTVENFTGTTTFSLTSDDLMFTGLTSLVFDTYGFTESRYGHVVYFPEEGEPWESKLPAHAWLDLINPTLTIHTALAPVPEPATWATMVAGFTLLAGVARRRQDLAKGRVII